MPSLVSATIVVQPPSETSPLQRWEPAPVLHVKFTAPFRHRTSITAKASIINWGGQEIKGGLTAAGPYFAVPKSPPAIYAPTEWNAYYCWEDLSCVEAGTYRLKVEVEVPGVGKDVVESRFVLVWRTLGLSERMSSPSADEFKLLKQLEEDVGKGPFRTVKYTRTGGPSWWISR